MTLTINEEIVSRYKAEGLSMEYIGSVLIILSLLHDQDVSILDAMDDSNKEKRMMMLYQYLDRKKFITKTAEKSPVLYQLTDRAQHLLKFVESQSDAPVAKTVEMPRVVSQNVSEWIKEWIDIFPQGKVNGRYLRTNDNDCAERMNWFVKEYGYDRDTIIQATKAYIKNQEESADSHTYTRSSGYFIVKDRNKVGRSSDLATWCKIVQDGEIIDSEYVERDAV